jgi:Protein of unknown function (DUF5131)
MAQVIPTLRDGYSVDFWRTRNEVSQVCAVCYAESRTGKSRNPRDPVSGEVDRGLLPGGEELPEAKHCITLESACEAARRCDREAREASQTLKIFTNSMGDFWADDRALDQARRVALETMQQTPNLTWMLLTRQPKVIPALLQAALELARSEPNASEEGLFVAWLERWLAGEPPRNVWLGTTIEDRAGAQQRILSLLKVPAAVRFLACDLSCPRALFGVPVSGASSSQGQTFYPWLANGPTAEAFLKDILNYLSVNRMGATGS